MSDLLKINVNDHVEKKNGLTYLSWAWAWSEVLKIDPEAQWAPLYFGKEDNQTPFLCLPDGSMMVGVSVQLRGHNRQCLLPVMNHRNQAIKNPDASAVNTAMMRCLAKAIALHGLGLSLYVGEDLWDDVEPVNADELIAKILSAKDLPELKVQFASAYKEVAKDKEALKKVNDAKETRKAQLSETS